MVRRVPAWLLPSHPRFELVLAALMVVLAEFELAVYGLLHNPRQALTGAAVAVPVALRFRSPLAAVALTGLAGAVEETQVRNSGEVVTPMVCMLLCLYALGAHGSTRELAAGYVVAGALLAAGLVIRQDVTSDLLLAAALPAAGLLIGRASGVLMLETEVLERERDEHTRMAIHTERSRIARELHDVIGHSISVMGVQAGAVRSVLPADRERERAALLSVERTGRDAVNEMRRLIGLLREDDAPADGPSPSLARVEALAAELRGAGQALTLTVAGEVDGLPPGLDLAAYRIVQEALVNALKHAPGAAVEARIELTREAVLIDVHDTGTGRPPSPDGHLGHGLLGMRERAALYGGEVDAGPVATGGFRVRAVLPVRP